MRHRLQLCAFILLASLMMACSTQRFRGDLIETRPSGEQSTEALNNYRASADTHSQPTDPSDLEGGHERFAVNVKLEQEWQTSAPASIEAYQVIEVERYPDWARVMYLGTLGAGYLIEMPFYYFIYIDESHAEDGYEGELDLFDVYPDEVDEGWYAYRRDLVEGETIDEKVDEPFIVNKQWRPLDQAIDLQCDVIASGGSGEDGGDATTTLPVRSSFDGMASLDITDAIRKAAKRGQSLRFVFSATDRPGATASMSYNSDEVFAMAARIQDVDWTAADDSAPPYFEASLKLLGDGSVVFGSQSAHMDCTIENRGTGDAFQLIGRISAPGSLADGMHVLFGRVPAGKSVTRSIALPLPRDVETSEIPVSIAFRELHGFTPRKLEAVVKAERLPRPILSYSYRIIDDGSGDSRGNADGRIQDRENVELELTIRNTGDGEAHAVSCDVQSSVPQSVSLWKNRFGIGNLGPGEGRTHRVVMQVKHDQVSDFSLSLNAVESNWDVKISDAIKLELDAESPEQVIALNAPIWIQPSAMLFSGASASTSLLGRTEDITEALATGQLGEWYRAELEEGLIVWVSSESVRTTIPAELVEVPREERRGGLVRLFQQSPPMIFVSEPRRLSTSKELRTTQSEMLLRGAVLDDQSLASVRILRNGVDLMNQSFKGVAGIAEGSPPNPGEMKRELVSRLPFEYSVPLTLGENRLEILAEDSGGTITRELYSVVREEMKGEVYVLVVGVGDYEDDEISDLAFAERDAQAVYDFFVADPRSPARPENVKLLKGAEATRIELMSAIQSHLAQKASENDTVIFYFSGHGFMEGEEFFMLPQNARRDTLSATGIVLGELQRLWGKIKAGRKLFITDACNAGQMTGLRDESSKSFAASLSGKGSVVLAAASSTQKAIEDKGLEHGLYTYFLLQAISGETKGYSVRDPKGLLQEMLVDSDQDGRIDVVELHRYVSWAVETHAREHFTHVQTPVARIDIDGPLYLTR